MARASSLFTIALSTMAISSGARLTLEEAVDRAVARVEREQTHLAAARANLQYLQAQSQMHWNFKPQIGLFALSNPVMLATSLGLSLLPTKGQSPAAWTWQNARLDELDAETELERLKLEARLGAARRYSDALAKQRIRDQFAEALIERRKEIERVREIVSAGHATALSLSRLQAAALDVELPLTEAAADYEEAIRNLQQFVGLGDSEDAEQLDLVDTLEKLPAAPLPPVEELVRQALLERPDIARLRARVAEPAPRSKRLKFDAGPLEYSKTSDGTGAVSNGGFPAGGNMLSLGLDVRFSNNGENRAVAALTEARTSALRYQLEQIEDSVRMEVRSLHSLVSAGRQKVTLAERRMEIAIQVRDAMRARERQGLETPEAVTDAENELLRVRTLLRSVEGEARFELYHLKTVCGLESLR